MRPQVTPIPLFALALALTLAVACASAPTASTPASVGSPQIAKAGCGFLGGHDGLSPVPDDESLLWFEKPGFDWRDYRGLMIEPLVIHVEPQAEHRQVEPDEVKALADYFLEAVQKELGESYSLTDTAGPDVLHIRAALTSIEPARPAVNVLTALVLPVRFDLGSASIEVEFFDSETGERLAAMVDTKAGSRLKAWQGFSKWGDARAAFRGWAEELRLALETNP